MPSPHPSGLPGHKDVSTMMIYTHVLNKPGLTVRSPLDNQSPARRRPIRWKIFLLILVRSMRSVLIFTSVLFAVVTSSFGQTANVDKPSGSSAVYATYT